MGTTSTRIKLLHEGRVLAAAYMPMDGHVSNFSTIKSYCFRELWQSLPNSLVRLDD